MFRRTAYCRSFRFKVFPHTAKEIGCFKVEKVASHTVTEKFAKAFTTFHWHGDTFTLPEDTVHLFKTKTCEQQGFVYNKHVAALQFHLELKEDLLNGMAENERAELINAEYVQTEGNKTADAMAHSSTENDV